MKINGVELFEWKLIDTADDGTEIWMMWATAEAFAYVMGKQGRKSTFAVNMFESVALCSGTSINLSAAKRHAKYVLISEYRHKAAEAGVKP